MPPTHLLRYASAAAAAATTAAARIAQADGCPIKSNKPSGGGGCPIKGSNNMPATPQQAKAPGQTTNLDTKREASTIPQKGGTQTWQYPSPQMFWNALVRKDKADGAEETDMDTVVAVHNTMNEATWSKILEWEKLREGPPPELVRFTGRPHDLSPKALLKIYVFGHPKPFDRHDWVVSRGDEERRYVIDYYSDEGLASKDERPRTMHDYAALKSIAVDARPALDSVGALLDRVVHMPSLRSAGEASPALPLRPPSSMKEDPRAMIREKCSSRAKALSKCGDDEKTCADAAIALQHCVASVVCPVEAEAFREAAVSNKNAEQAYQAMDAALDAWSAQNGSVLSERPD